uniref:Uncharacterized protein n=1 Tax=viral metagenome TaxID=1070528 RepID=A0A6M3LWD0_9ZZZZ
MSTIRLSGIVKHKHGRYGFKISFTTAAQANLYKEKIRWLIRDNQCKVEEEHGYHDL